MVTMVEVGPSSGEPGMWLTNVEQLPFIWPAVEKILLAKGKDTLLLRYEPRDVLQLISQQDIDLWVGVDKGKIEFVLLLFMQTYPKRKVYHTLWAGGKSVKKYLPMDKVEYYALLQGAVETEITGRRGWMKLFPSYKAVEVVLRKNIARRWGN